MVSGSECSLVPHGFILCKGGEGFSAEPALQPVSCYCSYPVNAIRNAIHSCSVTLAERVQRADLIAQVMDPIYYWKYSIKANKKLNAVSSRREFEGALLRIGEGFACLHPWPELGDSDLEGLLMEFRGNELVSDMARGAFRMARVDGAARKAGESLIDSVKRYIPESHATLPECSMSVVEESVRRGYNMIKLKGDRLFAGQLKSLEEIARRWPQLSWRIDFNEVLTSEETIGLSQRLSRYLRGRIDFLEDPCPWSREEWGRIRKRSGLNLARDRGSHNLEDDERILVVKPVRTDIKVEGLKGKTLVVTSNMDHPLGQCFAAQQAGKLGMEGVRLSIGGLQTHGLFEPDQFTERLGVAGPTFTAPGGAGLGFDDLLEKLPWKRLS